MTTSTSDPTTREERAAERERAWAAASATTRAALVRLVVDRRTRSPSTSPAARAVAARISTPRPACLVKAPAGARAGVQAAPSTASTARGRLGARARRRRATAGWRGLLSRRAGRALVAVGADARARGARGAARRSAIVAVDAGERRGDAGGAAAPWPRGAPSRGRTKSELGALARGDERSPSARFVTPASPASSRGCALPRADAAATVERREKVRNAADVRRLDERRCASTRWPSS